MNDIPDLDRVRPAGWPDSDWRDATSGEEAERLRELVAARQRSSRQEVPSLVTAELRKLSAAVEALRALSPPLLLPIPDAAKLLGVSISTIRRQVRAGELPSRHIGRSVRIDIAKCHGITAAEVAEFARSARSGRASK